MKANKINKKTICNEHVDKNIYIQYIHICGDDDSDAHSICPCKIMRKEYVYTMSTGEDDVKRACPEERIVRRGLVHIGNNAGECLSTGEECAGRACPQERRVWRGPVHRRGGCGEGLSTGEEGAERACPQERRVWRGPEEGAEKACPQKRRVWRVLLHIGWCGEGLSTG